MISRLLAFCVFFLGTASAAFAEPHFDGATMFNVQRQIRSGGLKGTIVFYAIRGLDRASVAKEGCNRMIILNFAAKQAYKNSKAPPNICTMEFCVDCQQVGKDFLKPYGLDNEYNDFMIFELWGPKLIVDDPKGVLLWEKWVNGSKQATGLRTPK